MNRNAAIGLALAAGCLLPVQVAFNTVLGRHAGGPVFGALASFLIGLVVILAVSTTRWMGPPNWERARRAPRWAWLSGLTAAFYITSTILVTPVVGLAIASATIVAGQLTSALVVDHFGLVGFAKRSTGWVRIGGALLLLMAVVMLVWGNRSGGSELGMALVAFLGGCCITIGLGMSNTFRIYVGTPIASTLVNFAGGSLALAIVAASGYFGRPDLAGLGTMPVWAWFGGLLGATYVTSVIIAAPAIGASLASAAIISGQMVGSLVLDQFGLFDLEPRPITAFRLVALVILAAGVWAVQREPGRKAVVVPAAPPMADTSIE